MSQAEGTVRAKFSGMKANEGVKWAKGEIEELMQEKQQNEYRASVDHYNNFVFYCKWDGKPLECFEQNSDIM